MRGRIAAHLGRDVEAEEAFQRAQVLASAMPYPYGKGRILHKWGVALRRADPVSARQRLEAALTIFRHLEASWHSARTEQALRLLEGEGNADPR